MIVGTAATNLLILLINLVTSILAARMLGPEGRGGLAVVLLYPQMVATIGLFGVDRSLSILGGKKTLNNAVLSIVIFTIGLALPIMAIVYFVVTRLLTDPDLVRLSLLYTLYVPALYFFMLSTALLNGLGRFLEYNVARFTFYGSYLLLIIVFWAVRFQNLDDFVYANLCSVYVTAIASGLLLFRARIQSGPIAVSPMVSDCLALTRKAAVFIIPGALAVASTRIDQVILSRTLDLRALGLFVVYLAFSQLIGPVANAVNVNVFHLSIVDSTSNIGRLFRISSLTYFSGLIIMALLAPFVVRLFYGESYLVDLSSARLLLVASFFLFSSQVFNEFLKGKSIVRPDIISQLIYIVILVVTAVFLVPRLLVWGMAIAMVAANAARWLYIIVTFSSQMHMKAADLLIIERADLLWLFQRGKMMVGTLRP